MPEGATGDGKHHTDYGHLYYDPIIALCLDNSSLPAYEIVDLIEDICSTDAAFCSIVMEYEQHKASVEYNQRFICIKLTLAQEWILNAIDAQKTWIDFVRQGSRRLL